MIWYARFVVASCLLSVVVGGGVMGAVSTVVKDLQAANETIENIKQIPDLVKDIKTDIEGIKKTQPEDIVGQAITTSINDPWSVLKRMFPFLANLWFIPKSPSLLGSTNEQSPAASKVILVLAEDRDVDGNGIVDNTELFRTVRQSSDGASPAPTFWTHIFSGETSPNGATQLLAQALKSLNPSGTPLNADQILGQSLTPLQFDFSQFAPFAQLPILPQLGVPSLLGSPAETTTTTTTPAPEAAAPAVGASQEPAPLKPFQDLQAALDNSGALLGQVFNPPSNPFTLFGFKPLQSWPAPLQSVDSNPIGEASEVSEVRVKPNFPLRGQLEERQTAYNGREDEARKLSELQIHAALQEALAKKTIPILWFRLPQRTFNYNYQQTYPSKTAEDVRLENRLQEFQYQVASELRQLQEIERRALEIRAAEEASGKKQQPGVPASHRNPLSKTPIHKITRGDIEKALQDEYMQRAILKAALPKYKITTNVSGWPIKRQATNAGPMPTMNKEDIVKMLVYAYRMAMANGENISQQADDQAKVEQKKVQQANQQMINQRQMQLEPEEQAEQQQRMQQQMLQQAQHQMMQQHQANQQLMNQRQMQPEPVEDVEQQAKQQQQMQQQMLQQAQHQMMQQRQWAQPETASQIAQQQRQWAEPQLAAQAPPQQFTQTAQMPFQQSQLTAVPQMVAQPMQFSQPEAAPQVPMQQRQWAAPPMPAQHEALQRQWVQPQAVPQIPAQQSQWGQAEATPQIPAQQRQWADKETVPPMPSEEKQPAQPEADAQQRQWAEKETAPQMPMQKEQQQRQWADKQSAPEIPTQQGQWTQAEAAPQIPAQQRQWADKESAPQMPAQNAGPQRQWTESNMQQQPQSVQSDSQSLVGEAVPQMPENAGKARHKGLFDWDLFDHHHKDKKKPGPTIINYYNTPGGSRYPVYGGYQRPYGGGAYGSNAYGGGRYRTAIGNDEIETMLRQHQLLPKMTDSEPQVAAPMTTLTPEPQLESQKEATTTTTSEDAKPVKTRYASKAKSPNESKRKRKKVIVSGSKAGVKDLGRVKVKGKEVLLRHKRNANYATLQAIDAKSLDDLRRTYKDALKEITLNPDESPAEALMRYNAASIRDALEKASQEPLHISSNDHGHEHGHGHEHVHDHEQEQDEYEEDPHSKNHYPDSPGYYEQSNENEHYEKPQPKMAHYPNVNSLRHQQIHSMQHENAPAVQRPHAVPLNVQPLAIAAQLPEVRPQVVYLDDEPEVSVATMKESPAIRVTELKRNVETAKRVTEEQYGNIVSPYETPTPKTIETKSLADPALSTLILDIQEQLSTCCQHCKKTILSNIKGNLSNGVLEQKVQPVSEEMISCDKCGSKRKVGSLNKSPVCAKGSKESCTNDKDHEEWLKEMAQKGYDPKYLTKAHQVYYQTHGKLDMTIDSPELDEESYKTNDLERSINTRSQESASKRDATKALPSKPKTSIRSSPGGTHRRNEISKGKGFGNPKDPVYLLKEDVRAVNAELSELQAKRAPSSTTTVSPYTMRGKFLNSSRSRNSSAAIRSLPSIRNKYNRVNEPKLKSSPSHESIDASNQQAKMYEFFSMYDEWRRRNETRKHRPETTTEVIGSSVSTLSPLGTEKSENSTSATAAKATKRHRSRRRRKMSSVPETPTAEVTTTVGSSSSSTKRDTAKSHPPLSAPSSVMFDNEQLQQKQHEPQPISANEEVASIFSFSPGLLRPYMGLHGTGHRNDPWHRKPYNLYRPLHGEHASYVPYLRRHRRAPQLPLSPPPPQRSYHQQQPQTPGLAPTMANYYNVLTPGMLDRLLRLRSDFKRTFPTLYKTIVHTNRGRITIKPPIIGSSVGPQPLELGAAERSPFDVEREAEAASKPKRKPDGKAEDVLVDYFQFDEKDFD